MKTACFVMMRNESPILGPFLDQIDALFDTCVILNHGSTDDSVEKVQSRNTTDRYSIYHLKASGYPQSEVATYFAREILSNSDCDFLFFLDCDEFLPFTDRTEFEEFLSRNSAADVLRLPWLNVCPEDLGSVDIFSNAFSRCESPSGEFYKVILNKTILDESPDFIVHQGYHDVMSVNGEQIKRVDINDSYCIHIPIQSRVQFGFKLVHGHNRLVLERTNIRKNQGSHWVDLARQFSAGSLDNLTLRKLALNYPYTEAPDQTNTKELKFDFRYVKNSYQETSEYICSQTAGLLDLSIDHEPQLSSGAFTVTDSAGEIFFNSGNEPGYAVLSEQGSDPANRELTKIFSDLSEDFSCLVEPLFNLPTMLPTTAWVGHIPFMFCLFKLLAPRTYVELGVHNGASLIAASTAARTYDLNTSLYGVDSWQGDEHAGHYEGNQIYEELKVHVDTNFSNTKLMRCFFSEAREKFAPGSIDLLHIDGLHTYDAVKEDFVTWFNAMTPTGVVLFHDICVHERGFGVHRLWNELKEQFTTLEFRHSHGLGVVLLDPNDSRIAPLRALAANESAMQVYRDLVSLVGSVISERMGYFNAAQIIAWRDQQIAEKDRLIAEKDRYIETIYQTKSWKVTAPLRALKSSWTTDSQE